MRAVVAVTAAVIVGASASVVSVTPRAGASGIAGEKAAAAILYHQTQTIYDRINVLSQKYDLAQINLNRITNRIVSTKRVVRQIEGHVSVDNARLRAGAIYAFVTSGALQGANFLFTTNPTAAQATSLYSQVAEGDIASTVAHLKNDSIQLTLERTILADERAQAATQYNASKRSVHAAQNLERTLQQKLRRVKGVIATYFAAVQAAAAAAAKAAAAQALRAAAVQAASPPPNFPAPAPSSVANIAVRAALSFLGVPYVWGGASRSGVDCSGLVMLAYEAAGISLPHYSGAQFADTVRVPLYDIQPGDILFYGPNGDTHEAMYIGHGEMIQAEQTGTLVQITPLWLGNSYLPLAGIGRPRG